MHKSIDGHNRYNLFNLRIDYIYFFTTIYLLTIEHMAMFVVKSSTIKING